MKDLKKRRIVGNEAVKPPVRQIDLTESREMVRYLTKDKRRRLRYWLVLLFGLCLAGYITWQLYGIISPPLLVIDNPSADVSVKGSHFTIRGQVEPESVLNMNQETILPDLTGYFSQDVFLQPGINTFVFTAKKRYSRSIEVIRHIYLESTTTSEIPKWSFIN